MNCWQVLGIEPGSDRKTIKRAYARLLKEVHPEDKPEEFMILRQAYENALAALKVPQPTRVFTVEQPVRDPGEPFAWEHADAPAITPARTIEDGSAAADIRPAAPEPPLIEQEPDAPMAGPDVPVIEDEPQPASQPRGRPEPPFASGRRPVETSRVSELAYEMEALLKDPALRNDLSRWETLLLAPELNDIDASPAVAAYLVPRVNQLLQSGDRSCPLDGRVLLLLDNRFQWTMDHSGHLPVTDDQLTRLCLLIEAARESTGSDRPRKGWKWLAEALFNWRGRLSRIEFFLTAGVACGLLVFMLVFSAVAVSAADMEFALVVLSLAMCYSLLSIWLKRVRDAGIHPLQALVLGVIFPFANLYYAFAGPKENLTDPDPRLQYMDAYERTYAEYYLADGKLPLSKRVRDRLTGIHPGVYLALVAVWGASALLVSW